MKNNKNHKPMSKKIKRCRTPEGLKVPITIEYHFTDTTTFKADAEAFKMPKKYKDRYNLLFETFERVNINSGFYRAKPTILSYYRILQLKAT